MQNSFRSSKVDFSSYFFKDYLFIIFFPRKGTKKQKKKSFACTKYASKYAKDYSDNFFYNFK